MRTSRKRRLAALAAPFLMPGEQIEIMTAAKLGRIPTARNLAAATAAVASMAVLGVAGGVYFVQKEAYIVLTDRQVVLFEADRTTGGPTKYLASVRRAEATASVVKDGRFRLKVQLDVSAPTGPVSLATTRLPSMRLTFPPLSPYCRRTGRQFAASLHQDAVTERPGVSS